MSSAAASAENYLDALNEGRDWTALEMRRFMTDLVSGRLEEAVIVRALEGLRAKGFNVVMPKRVRIFD